MHACCVHGAKHHRADVVSSSGHSEYHAVCCGQNSRVEAVVVMGSWASSAPQCREHGPTSSHGPVRGKAQRAVCSRGPAVECVRACMGRRDWLGRHGTIEKMCGEFNTIEEMD